MTCCKDLKPALPKAVRILKHEQLNARINRLTLDARIDCQPGQFVMLWIPRVDEKPFSVDGANPLTITYAKFGAFTQALSKLQVGDKVGWRGPLGKGFNLVGQRQLVVAGGVGLASVMDLVRVMCSQKLVVDVVVGAKNQAEIYGLDELRSLGVGVYPCTDDGSVGFKGFTTDQTTLLLTHNKYDQAYACGPEVMLVKLHKLLSEAKLPHQLSLERYMKCGLGICDLCSIDGFLTCQDGPVFNEKQIDQMEEFGKVYRIVTGEEVAVSGKH